jgi:hypothetical protein
MIHHEGGARMNLALVSEVDFPHQVLSCDLLERLARNDIAAVRLKHFLSEQSCLALSGRFVSDQRCARRLEGIHVLGQAHAVVMKKEEPLKEPYFAVPNPYVRILNEHASALGIPSPLETILRVLGAAWPVGIQCERFDYGAPMSPFIVRLFESGHRALAHQDCLADKMPYCRAAAALKAQWGLNLYLNMPDEGGELELYLRYVVPAAFDLLRLDGENSYAIDTARVGDVLVRLRPEVGDLILFNSTLLHSTAQGQGPRKRVTLSAFVGMRGRSEPLTIWA